MVIKKINENFSKQILFGDPILKIKEVIRHAVSGRLSEIEKDEIRKEIENLITAITQACIASSELAIGVR